MTSDLLVSAMLTVEDDEFWEGVSPVEFGPLPALQDAVTVVGYPIGGDTISVTSGVVSRIDIPTYVICSWFYRASWITGIFIHSIALPFHAWKVYD
jgi:hypothetical protein